jgi:sporulation protein YlmC with PRC-barrel domain/ribosomal protein L37E
VYKLEERSEERYHRLDELVGKDVYDAKAKKIGTVVDMGYSKNGKTALIIRVASASILDKSPAVKELVLSHVDKGRFAALMFGRVSEIGDIILLKPEPQFEYGETPDSIHGKIVETAQTKPCPECGRENERIAKFCIECGYDFRKVRSSHQIENAANTSERINDRLI